MIVYCVAALALLLNKCDTNRAAIFLYAVFYSISMVIELDNSSNYFIWSIISSTGFIFSLSMLSRATKLVVLLALFDIILTSIDLISLVAYNLSIEWIYQYRSNATYYVGIAQLTCLLVRDERSVNIGAIRYNISLYANNARRFFVHRSKIH